MSKELKEYTCNITLRYGGATNETLRYGGNRDEATSENEYKQKVKDSFFQETGIKLAESEISDVQESQ